MTRGSQNRACMWRSTGGGVARGGGSWVPSASSVEQREGEGTKKKKKRRGREMKGAWAFYRKESVAQIGSRGING